MPIAAIGGAISGVSSLVGGILGHNAASDAAAKQAAAAKAAASGQQAAGLTAQNDLSGQIANEAKVSAPYTSLGSQTSNELQNALAPGGQLTQNYGAFTAPTAAEAAQTPGYQFQLQQGLNALQNSAAARGGLLSTGTAKNLENYAQGLASTNYQNTFNNALNAYGTNFNVWNANNSNLYSRLAGATGLGETAANSLNALQGQGTQALASNIVGNQQLVGNDLMGVGNAQASGIVGSTNALTQGLAGAANAANQTISLQQILGAQNAGGSFGGGDTGYGSQLLYAGGQAGSQNPMSTYAPYGAPIVNPYG